MQVALLVVFLYFFGPPAIARFAKMDVMVVETMKLTKGIHFSQQSLSLFPIRLLITILALTEIHRWRVAQKGLHSINLKLSKVLFWASKKRGKFCELKKMSAIILHIIGPLTLPMKDQLYIAQCSRCQLKVKWSILSCDFQKKLS